MMGIVENQGQPVEGKPVPFFNLLPMLSYQVCCADKSALL